MWSNHSCLKSKTFDMPPLGFRVMCLLILQPLYSSISFAQCAHSHQNICKFWEMPYTFPLGAFLSCDIFFRVTPYPLIFLLSSRSSLTFLRRIFYHFLCPYKVLCLFSCCSTYQINDNLFIYMSASPTRLWTRIRTQPIFYSFCSLRTYECNRCIISGRWINSVLFNNCFYIHITQKQYA